ncbi:Adaptor protein that links actin to clathrin and endocytosis [Komagataella phaffii CBS 7435]|nr:GQ68_05257T0 [Komagataella phaffii GS115]CAH2450369.1 Transmembrane actin-binding protein involved in membrane cytoskeleton assembly and cell polarization [Komagataella phaffii CBS 7435]CCA40183.1 Adaptor protein that links actin to clathrin and endocytosis [Komagataella phaffii CBS 7435]
MSRQEADLKVSIKKACSTEEAAPKRKHVRACIVFTWDHRSSKAFYNGLRLLPIQNDEIPLFKSLITIHKVLQEGHPSAIKEGIKNRDWIQSLGHVFPGDGMKRYGRLIREYDRYLIRKIDFHNSHKGFNGTFEYEEYVSLKTVSDPNEGYEAIMDLMVLQDSINDLQRLLFASIDSSSHSELKISALVPLIAESYGIFKFITSMLRGMCHSLGHDDEALQPLIERFISQYSDLYDFYAECSYVKYLTSLVNIPKLPFEAPDLFNWDETDELKPRILAEEPSLQVSSKAPSEEFGTPTEVIHSQPTAGTDLWAQSNALKQQYEQEQQLLEQERQQQLLEQQHQQQQQLEYWEKQKELQEQQQLYAQQQLESDQLQRQVQGRVGELERDLLILRGQFDRDQLMLRQYDERVKALETELSSTTQNAQQQLGAKEELLGNIQEQAAQWKSKYDSLAKLYSQLREEHLNLLSKFKTAQLKASSAREAIDKREKIERDLKAKNIELADLIRERDRARLDLERSKSDKNSETERLEARLREQETKLADIEKLHSSELKSFLSQHNKEIEELQNQLQASSLSESANERLKALEAQLQEKDDELAIAHQTMEATIKELTGQQSIQNSAIDEQIDAILLEHIDKLTEVIDAILTSGVQRIQDGLFELDSPMQAGNQNSSPEYLSSIIEKSSNLATEFTSSFNGFIADGPNGDHVSVIQTITEFTTSIVDLLLNCKGVVRLASSDQEAEALLNSARDVAEESESFIVSLYSSSLKGLSDQEKTDKAIEGNVDIQQELQTLSSLVEKLISSQVNINVNDNVGELVDREMAHAAETIAKASDHLTDLLTNAKQDISTIDMKINNSILSAAIAVTKAIILLIKTATDCQNEIVNHGRGSSSRTSFYKKHNKWTEGLISASKSVAYSTNSLIQIADGVLSSTSSPEQLIVACNDVAASTAQLVAASRVKASFMSKTQDKLELASKSVTSACRSLVRQVQEILSQKDKEELEIDYSKLSAHENKTVQMEQQVEILKLETALQNARRRLGEIRRFGYHADEE